MAEGAGIDRDLHERMVADRLAVIDLLERGATRAQIELIDEVSRRVMAAEFRATDLTEAARQDPALAWFLVRAEVGQGSARSLGKMLGRLQGGVVEHIGEDRDGHALWRLHWPRRSWIPAEFGPAQTRQARRDAAKMRRSCAA